MTIFEKIKSMNIDELAEYMDKHWTHDNDPSIKWWNKEYCSKCEPVTKYVDYLGREEEYAWCEVNDDRCKFFPELDILPDTKQMMKLWLESEVE